VKFFLFSDSSPFLRSDPYRVKRADKSKELYLAKAVMPRKI